MGQSLERTLQLQVDVIHCIHPSFILDDFRLKGEELLEWAESLRYLLDLSIGQLLLVTEFC